MQKLKMHSPDMTQEHIARIRELFPNCVTEARGKDGSLRLSVDFDLLRQELSGSIVEGPQERYHLDWPGKRKAMLAANAPIAKALRPCREESVDFDTTKNLFIEGDNLDALKLLQETYLGKVKMIYIDPPYNTGKDFIYRDDFAETAEEYLLHSNQKDEKGNRLVANTESNGRFHSDWLSMMYPRLKIARNLLADDGAILVSINHNELNSLCLLLDEIFSQENLLCLFSWRTDGNFDNQAKFKFCHEYIVMYGKNEKCFLHPQTVDPNISEDSKIYLSEIKNTIVKNGPKNPPSFIEIPAGFPTAFESGCIKSRNNKWPHILEDIKVSNFKTCNRVTVYSGWSSKELLENFISLKFNPVIDSKGQETTFLLSQSGAIEAIKSRSVKSHVISSLTGFGGSQKASAILAEISIPFFDYPKPISLIKYLLTFVDQQSLILDFFAGSSTTAHAVMQLNAEDGGNRRFIMVQLPEACDAQSEAAKAGYSTIAEISKERIRRAGKKILEGDCHEGWNRDVGFRVLKVDTSNMADVFYTPDALQQNLLDLTTDNIKPGRTPEDLLFQVLLDWGVELTLPIRKESIQGKTVFFVDDNALVACFDRGIDEALVRELAACAPLRVVFRDNGFVSDAVKINVEQIFRQLSPGTEVRCL